MWRMGSRISHGMVFAPSGYCWPRHGKKGNELRSKGNCLGQLLRIMDYDDLQEPLLGSQACSAEDEGESYARELCGKSKVSYGDVWGAILKSSLKPRSTDRSKITEGSKEKLSAWTLQMFFPLFCPL